MNIRCCSVCGISATKLNNAKNTSLYALMSLHEHNCESDAEFDTMLGRVEELLATDGYGWDSRYKAVGFDENKHRTESDWIRRRTGKIKKYTPVAGKRKEKLVALGYDEDKGFYYD